MLIQFNETDWEFLKRLCSHFHEGICEDSQSGNIQLFFGFPTQAAAELIGGKLESRRINVLENQESLSIRTPTNYLPGTAVSYRRTRYLLETAELFMERGEMLSRLRLVRNTEQLFPYQANAFIAGARIRAVVTAVNRNRMRLRFQTEDKEAGNTPYLPYAGEVNNEDGFYMPDTGNEVEVYFPDSEEKNGMVVFAERTLKEDNADFDYSMKYMGNKEQIKLCMDEKTVNLLAGASGTEIKMGADGILIINAQETLHLGTGRNLELKSRVGKVSMYAEKKICLNAGTLEKTSVTLENSGNIICKSSNRVVYKRNEGTETVNTHGGNMNIDAHGVRNAGLALSGVEFLSQAITGTSDFKSAQRIMNRLLGKSNEPGNAKSHMEQSDGNLIKEKLFQNNERLFNSFSYGENKNG